MRQIVKIIAGEFRGRILKTPSVGTHPMGSRERLALFNMVSAGMTLTGAKVLDTYAGSGVLGFEALSRGAAAADLVDINKEACAVIRENAQKLGAMERTRVYQKSVNDFVKNANEEYDVIFADPPYDKENLDEALAVARLLAPEGIFVLSSPKDLALDFMDLQVLTTKTYARARLTLLKR